MSKENTKDINILRENNHHLYNQSIDLYILWILHLICQRFGLERAVFLQWNEELKKWIQCVDILGIGLSQMPGSGYIFNDVPEISDLQNGQWIYCPTESVGIDAVNMMIIGDLIFLLGIDKITEARSFTASEQKELKLYSEFMKESLQIKMNIDRRPFNSPLDKLTDMGNRFAFEKFIKSRQFLESGKKCLVICNLDGLSYLSSQYNFYKTDEIILRFSQMLSSLTGSKFFRVGLDKFAGIVQGSPEKVQNFVAVIVDMWTHTRLEALKSEPVWQQTLTAGICEFAEGISYEEVWMRADAAFSVARKINPGTACFADIHSDVVIEIGRGDFDLDYVLSKRAPYAYNIFSDRTEGPDKEGKKLYSSDNLPVILKDCKINL